MQRLALIAILLVVPLVFGHEPVEEGAQGLVIMFSPLTAPLGADVVYTLEIFDGTEPVSGAVVDLVFDLQPRGISDRIRAREREAGHYYAHYTIREPHPEWEVHAEVSYNGEALRRSWQLSVISPVFAISPEMLPLALTAFILIAGAVAYLLIK